MVVAAVCFAAMVGVAMGGRVIWFARRSSVVERNCESRVSFSDAICATRRESIEAVNIIEDEPLVAVAVINSPVVVAIMNSPVKVIDEGELIR